MYRMNGHSMNGRGFFNGMGRMGRLNGLGQAAAADVPKIESKEQAERYLANKIYSIDELVSDATTYWLPTARTLLNKLAEELKASEPSAWWIAIAPLKWLLETAVAKKASDIITPQKVAEIEKYLYGAVRSADDILDHVKKLFAAGVIDKASADKLFGHRSMIITATSNSFVALKNLQSRGELSSLARTLADIGVAIEEFGRVSGLTKTLRSIWEAGVKPIIEGAADLAQTLKAILKWLPWIAVGGAALYLLGPTVYRTVTQNTPLAYLSNPRRSRSRSRGYRVRSNRKGEASILPLGLIGGGIATALLLSKARAVSTIPTGPSATGIPVPMTPTGAAVNAGSVEKAAAAAQVKIELAKAGIAYSMSDTGKVFTFFVPPSRLVQAQKIVWGVRSQYDFGAEYV